MATLKGGEAEIHALMERFTAAFNSGDIDAMMKNYLGDDSFIIFDIVPRKEYRGAGIYRKYWEEMFSHFKEGPKITISGLGVTVEGNIGFGYSFQHVTGTDIEGNPVSRTVRVTNGFRKIGHTWLIALEHVSVPVDLKTGKAAFESKP